ncbi:ornithine cyclodeaminase family protein [Carnobacterium gallinarum]|uniref:ornithine cyclodeaminase family protein n=1 Tax=Carnobacterium gallinarum TaxID=2749 RepID=UPI00055053B5|nr:ornithine cyclodeaminase family protein [Carnobacterium gallinarum]
MKVIEAQEVHQLLTMKKSIDVMKETFLKFQQKEYIQPIRRIDKLPDKEQNIFAFMPAYLGEDSYFGAKLITSFAKNQGTKYSSHLGYVMLFQSQHGNPVALIDASSITQIRTAAVSGVATELLANEDAKTLALIGAGVQARSHLAAILAVRSIEQVYVYDIFAKSAENFKTEMEAQYGCNVIICKSVESAVAEADIICTLTPSKEAYLKPEWIKQGAHINAIGTFTPTTREITSELMAQAELFVDDYDAIKKESGDYLIPLNEKIISDTHIKASLGELLTKEKSGKSSSKSVTIFNAVGLAVEDIACAKFIFEASEQN